MAAYQGTPSAAGGGAHGAPVPAGRVDHDLLRPAPTHVPDVVPWPEDDPAAAHGGGGGADGSGVPHAARAAAMLVLGELPREARAATYNPAGGLYGHDPAGTSTQTGGGVLGELATLYGETRRLGADGGDDGLGDAEIPVREPTRSYLQRDKPTRLPDRINHYLRMDPNLLTGPQGLLPYQRTTDASVVYDTWEFKPSFAQPTPELAPTRFLSFSKKRFQHAFMRLGIGIRGTTDFYKSPEGRRIFFEQVKQIMNTIQETASFGVLYALVTADAVNRQWLRRLKSYRNAQAELDVLEDELFRWDAFKAKLGLEKVDARVQERVRAEGGDATTWVVAPEASVYMALESAQRYEARLAGESLAISAREDSVDALRRWGRGNVMIARTYNVDKRASRNPLQFRAQIGEYYLARNVLHGYAEPQGAPAPMYNNRCAELEIYDETADEWARFTLQQMVDACGLFDEHGDLVAPPQIYDPLTDDQKRDIDERSLWMATSATELEWKTIGQLHAMQIDMDTDTASTFRAYDGSTVSVLVATREHVDGATGVIVRATEVRDLHQSRGYVTRNFLEGLIKANLPLPIAFILGRPHAEYATLAALKVLPGLATGATFVKDGIFSVGEDATVQEIGGQFTFESKSIVTNDKNVYVAHNTFVNGYHGGMSAGVIHAGAGAHHYNPSENRYGPSHTTGRRASQPGVHSDVDRPSVYVFAVPYTEVNVRGKLKNPLSLHGDLAGNYGGGLPSVPLALGGKHGFSSLPFYEALYEFQDRILPSPDPHSADFVNDVLPTNAVMWRGHTRHWDPKAQQFGTESSTSKGTGHWGPDGTYLGCKLRRRGNLSKDMSGA